MTLEFSARIAERDFDVTLTQARGEVIAVLGPNGAGKSTLLQLIAGLVRPDAGEITLEGRVVTAAPPHRRGVALLAQDPLLFPHMTVEANVAFAPRSAGRRDATQIARRWLAAVDAGDLAARKPGQLSGGQAQRVAIARALAADPHLLLLDEPMAALDVGAAPAIRKLLRRVLADRTAIVVTHDIVDVLSLADRAIVIEGGRVTEDGAARTVLARPRSAFAAQLTGVNLLTGTMTANGLDTPVGPVHGIVECEPGQPAAAVFAPAAVAVYLKPPEGSPRNAFRDRIAELEGRGGVIRVHGERGLLADVTPAAVADLELAPGQDVSFVVKAAEVSIYPM